MEIGLNGTGLVQRADVVRICDHAKQAAADGFSSYWLAEHPTGGFDALTVLAAVGQQVAENGGPRLQNRCGAARVALGVFDSHTFPPIYNVLLKKGLQGDQSCSPFSLM